jgi:hypothetical protein
LVQGQARGWTVRCGLAVGARDFSLLYDIQTGFGFHPASSPLGTYAPFPGDNVVRPWSLPHVHLVLRSRVVVELCLLPYMSSWCGAYLIKHTDFTSVHALIDCLLWKIFLIIYQFLYEIEDLSVTMFLVLAHCSDSKLYSAFDSKAFSHFKRAQYENKF